MATVYPLTFRHLWGLFVITQCVAQPPSTVVRTGRIQHHGKLYRHAKRESLNLFGRSLWTPEWGCLRWNSSSALFWCNHGVFLIQGCVFYLVISIHLVFWYPRQLQNKNDPNISFCPADHPFISVATLEAEGQRLLDALAALLYSSQYVQNILLPLVLVSYQMSGIRISCLPCLILGWILSNSGLQQCLLS